MTTIQVALFEGSKKVEDIGEYLSLDTAISDANSVLQEIAPNAKTSVKCKGDVDGLVPGAVQTIKANGTPFLVTLSVMSDEHIDPSLVETEPKAKAAKKGDSEVIESSAWKKVAPKYPAAIQVGVKKWWGCDQHTVLNFIDTHPEEAKEHGIELRKRSGRFALVCDKTTVWTCSYESVAQYAAQVAKERVEQLKAA